MNVQLEHHVILMQIVTMSEVIIVVSVDLAGKVLDYQQSMDVKILTSAQQGEISAMRKQYALILLVVLPAIAHNQIGLISKVSDNVYHITSLKVKEMVIFARRSL